MVLVTTYTQNIFLFFSPHNQFKGFHIFIKLWTCNFKHTVSLNTGIFSSAVFFKDSKKKE